jgi:hypothetical protein
MGCIYSKQSSTGERKLGKNRTPFPNSHNKRELYDQEFTQLVKDMKRIVELGRNPEYFNIDSGMSAEQCLVFCLNYIDWIDMEGNIPQELRNEPLVEIRNVEVKESSTGKRGTWAGMKRLE